MTCNLPDSSLSVSDHARRDRGDFPIVRSCQLFAPTALDGDSYILTRSMDC